MALPLACVVAALQLLAAPVPAGVELDQGGLGGAGRRAGGLAAEAGWGEDKLKFHSHVTNVNNEYTCSVIY